MFSDLFAPVRAVRFVTDRAVRALRERCLRPILSFFRLLLFLIRGLDALVARFSPLINRNFIFFEDGTQRGEEVQAGRSAAGGVPVDPT